MNEYSVYCVHGTYIGYPGGPDYICGMCEMGLTTPVKGTQSRIVLTLNRADVDKSFVLHSDWMDERHIENELPKWKEIAESDIEFSEYTGYTCTIENRPVTYWEES